VDTACRARAADRVAADTGAILVPPYDHPDVIAGPGTVGLESAGHGRTIGPSCPRPGRGGRLRRQRGAALAFRSAVRNRHTGTMNHSGPTHDSGPTNASVVAVCTVHEVKPDPGGPVGHTGIDKRPVPGPVRVSRLGLAGDTQCDPGRHGGPDKALYAYAEAEAQRWAAELGRPVPPGTFGENLVIRGLAVTDAVVGERWQLGPEVLAEVTAPRTPCATFARHIDQPRWVRRFSDRADVGAYLRVLTPGFVTAGDAVHRVHVPEHGVTAREVFTALIGDLADPDRLALLLSEQSLAARLRGKLERVLSRR
jgi:MOSC domain-containing protein YiiM